MREFKLREGEIDAKRENRIFVLQQALQEKNESAEFLASQRVESIRQARMEERETNLQKLNKGSRSYVNLQTVVTNKIHN